MVPRKGLVSRLITAKPTFSDFPENFCIFGHLAWLNSRWRGKKLLPFSWIVFDLTYSIGDCVYACLISRQQSSHKIPWNCLSMRLNVQERPKSYLDKDWIGLPCGIIFFLGSSMMTLNQANHHRHSWPYFRPFYLSSPSREVLSCELFSFILE